MIHISNFCLVGIFLDHVIDNLTSLIVLFFSFFFIFFFFFLFRVVFFLSALQRRFAIVSCL